jgi:hypothetical protein
MTSEADEWMTEKEPLVLFKLNNDVRAYPLQILIWHELVNDVVGGVPVLISFCPLCYSAMVFKRPVVGGKLLTFGTSGNLRHNDLVMWDRETESWWQQITGEAVVGSLTGSLLERLPASIVSWKTLLEVHPGALVLSRDTGYDRQYGRNPYVDYDRPEYVHHELEHLVDGRLRAMDRVVGVDAGNVARAYRLNDLQRKGLQHDLLGGTPIVIFWRPGTVSAVDHYILANGRDIGETGAFSRMLDDRLLTFVALGDGTFRDNETGTRWSITGNGLSGPYRGFNLKPLLHHDVFWFAWSIFKPGSTLSQPGEPTE